jgi:hypothetical protein
MNKKSLLGSLGDRLPAVFGPLSGLFYVLALPVFFVGSLIFISGRLISNNLMIRSHKSKSGQAA